MDITKYGPQLSIALKQATVLLRQAQDTLTGLGRRMADKSRQLQEAVRPRVSNYLWQLFRRSQNTLTIVRRSAFDTLRSLQATSLRTIERTKDRIIKFGSRLFAGLAQLSIRLQRGQDMLRRLGRSFIDQPRRLQKTLQSRENELRELLVSSLDAIVVTNADHCLVAANSKALDLFGVTRTNMRQFTIDAFLSHSQIQRFDGRRLPFARRETGCGKCEIRRLDGSLRVAEYGFVANFTPFRHLCRFRNVIVTHQYQPATQKTIDRKSAQ